MYVRQYSIGPILRKRFKENKDKSTDWRGRNVLRIFRETPQAFDGTCAHMDKKANPAKLEALFLNRGPTLYYSPAL